MDGAEIIGDPADSTTLDGGNGDIRKALNRGEPVAVKSLRCLGNSSTLR